MKLTKRRLQRIIQEELDAILREEEQYVGEPGQKHDPTDSFMFTGEKDTQPELGTATREHPQFGLPLKHHVKEVPKRQELDRRAGITQGKNVSDRSLDTYNEMAKENPALAQKFNDAKARGDTRRLQKYREMWQNRKNKGSQGN